MIIPPKSARRIGTDIAMAIPKGTYLCLASRSSLALTNINVGGGVIDNDFRGKQKYAYKIIQTMNFMFILGIKQLN